MKLVKEHFVINSCSIRVVFPQSLSCAHLIWPLCEVISGSKRAQQKLTAPSNFYLCQSNALNLSVVYVLIYKVSSTCVTNTV